MSEHGTGGHTKNNNYMKKLLKISFFSLMCFLSTHPLIAQNRSNYIDTVALRALKAFNVPGMAVAVVKDGKVVHMKGYGVASLNTGKSVDANTLFAVASNSKAFTAAALGILVDEGKLSWNTRVADIIPEFRLYNSYVTEDFNIKDLLCHRSGMGLGAGDLMIWPDSASFSTSEIIHNLRYLKQVSSFRTKYDYDNLLYIVAGEVVKRVSGESWESFVESRIMKPLGMERSAASPDGLKSRENIIDSHIEYDGKVQVVVQTLTKTANAAAGVVSSVNDMSKWVMAMLNEGVYGKNGERLFGKAVHQELWTPQTIIPVRGATPYKTNFSAYALGWRVSDMNGYKSVTHTGMLAGVVTQVMMVPELKLGIIVFTNQQTSEAFGSVTYTILDRYFGVKNRDWVADLKESLEKSRTNAGNIVNEVYRVSSEESKKGLDYSQFVSKYRDSWFGDVTISLENGKLFFKSVRSPRMRGEVLPYRGNLFIVRWEDRSFDADAFINFSFGFDGTPSGFTMKAISPLTDFSFDFQDLDFHKLNEK